MPVSGLAALAAAVGLLGLMLAIWMLQRRSRPILRLQVSRWTEPRWYLLRIELVNRSMITLSAIELEVRSPLRAKLLERGFLDRFAIPGRDGVRRPDLAAAVRSVPLPLEAGPAGSRRVVESASLRLEEVSGDSDRGEVLLYMPRAWRGSRARLSLHYVQGNQPERRRRFDVVASVGRAR